MGSTLLPLATRSSSKGSRSRYQRSATLPTSLPEIIPKSTLISPIISHLDPTTRIDLLHPPSVPRRTVFLETTDSQHHMHTRCALMQRQKWMREHGEWQKPIYGSRAVKEDYKFQIRETLKTQMEDQKRIKERQWNEAVNESIVMSQKDYQDRIEDASRRKEKYEYLNTYTKANKEIMESRWRAQKQEKIIENIKDLQQLQYNPINWTQTLK